MGELVDPSAHLDAPGDERRLRRVGLLHARADACLRRRLPPPRLDNLEVALIALRLQGGRALVGRARVRLGLLRPPSQMDRLRRELVLARGDGGRLLLGGLRV